MKRYSSSEDSFEKKRFKEDEYKLYKLDPSAVDIFLNKLAKKAAKDWPAAASAFDGFIHTCMTSYEGPEATRMIAYDVDKYVQGDDSNEDIITVSTLRKMKVADMIQANPELCETTAEEILFPKANRRLIEAEKITYLQQVQAIINYAEHNINKDILLKLNNDISYRQVKQDRCLIGWTRIVKAKGIHASDSLELAKRNIESQLERLQMDDSIDGYYTLREKFKSLVSCLRNIPNYRIDEKHLIGILAVKINSSRFPNIFFEFTSGRYKDVDNLKDAYRILNEIQERSVTIQNQYQGLYGAKQENNSDHRKRSFYPSDKTPTGAVVNFNAANHNNTKEEKNEKSDKISKLCKFFKAGINNSCKNSACRFIHLTDDKIITELEELEKRKKELMENAKS